MTTTQQRQQQQQQQQQQPQQQQQQQQHTTMAATPRKYVRLRPCRHYHRRRRLTDTTPYTDQKLKVKQLKNN